MIVGAAGDFVIVTIRRVLAVRRIVTKTGNYSLIVENEFGCLAQDFINVKIHPPKMIVPNVFTPNGKGPNEQFYPIFKGRVYDFELYIYSRWGELVFERRRDMVTGNDLKGKGWDGTYKGKQAAIGVYVWIVFYEGQERDHGTVTLFR